MTPSSTLESKQINVQESRTSGGAFNRTVDLPTPGGSATIDTSNARTVAGQTRNGKANVSISSYTVSASTDPNITPSVSVAHISNFAPTDGLSYTEYGQWTVDETTAAPAALYAGVYGGGKPGVAPTAAMPTTGTATYSGSATGYVSQADSTASTGTLANFSGTATLTANFSSGAMTGSVTGINAYGIGGSNRTLVGTVNDIAFGGAITGNSFVANATAQGTAGTAFDITGSKGTMSGAFYGPTAQEVAGTFSLTGGTHSVTVLGAFGAASAAPCDLRLKTDVEFLEIRADGLKLYSWRYLGSESRHAGPIAQDMLQDHRFANHVSADSSGFLWVDFAGLGFLPESVRRMRAEGEQAIARMQQA